LWLAAAGCFVAIAFIASRVWAPVRRTLAAPPTHRTEG